MNTQLITSFVTKTTGLDAEHVSRIFKRYTEPHRVHHGLSHPVSILCAIRDDTEIDDQIVTRIFVLAALYHDAIYDPREKPSENERASARLFTKECAFRFDGGTMAAVNAIILSTGNCASDSEYCMHRSWIDKFMDFDQQTLYENLQTAIKHSLDCYKEYSFVDYAAFVEAHINIIKKLDEANGGAPIWRLHHFNALRSYKPTVGIMSGSFDPFHIGHLDILNQARQLFDKIVVARGINPNKHDVVTGNSIASIEGVPLNIETIEFSCMLHELYAHYSRLPSYKSVTLVRGFRSASDVEYELNQKRYVEDLLGAPIPYVFLTSNPELSHISSSAINAIRKFNTVDTSRWLPDGYGRVKNGSV
jgi:pantetheine-phosphate adenylyltransferase